MSVKRGAILKTSSTFVRFPMKKMYIVNGKKWEFKLVASPDLNYCTLGEAKDEMRRLGGAGYLAKMYKRAWISPSGQHRIATVCYALDMKHPKKWSE
jgi:hypothetical protein